MSIGWFSQSAARSDQTKRMWWLIWFYTGSKCLMVILRRTPQCRIRLKVYTCWSSKCLLVCLRRVQQCHIRMNVYAGWSMSLLAINACGWFSRSVAWSDQTERIYSRSIARSDHTKCMWLHIWLYTGSKCLLVVFRRSPHSRIRLNGYTCWSDCILSVTTYWLVFAERRMVGSEQTDILADLCVYYL